MWMDVITPLVMGTDVGTITIDCGVRRAALNRVGGATAATAAEGGGLVFRWVVNMPIFRCCCSKLSWFPTHWVRGMWIQAKNEVLSARNPKILYIDIQ